MTFCCWKILWISKNKINLKPFNIIKVFSFFFLYSDLIETQSPTTISSSSTSPTVLGSLSLPPPSQDPHLQQHPSLLHQPHTSAALSQQSHPPPLQQAPPQLHQQLHQLQQHHEDKNSSSSLFSVSPHPLGRSSPSSPPHKQDCQPPVPPSPTNVASTHSTNILQGKMNMLDSYSRHNQPKNSVLNSLFSLNSAMMEKPDAGKRLRSDDQSYQAIFILASMFFQWKMKSAIHWFFSRHLFTWSKSWYYGLIFAAADLSWNCSDYYKYLVNLSKGFFFLFSKYLQSGM